jgi:hypothetical protein
VKFWDASALVPLLVDEPSTEKLRALALEDPQHVVWWAASVECISAIARQAREGRLFGQALETAKRRLALTRENWIEIPPSVELRTEAERLLHAVPLRASDALQLAAALAAAEGTPDVLDFVSLDDRLSEAARQEGFDVLP